MRVLQLIDSLDAGGAEQVAVNMANGLSRKIEASFLCATRKEGLLKRKLNNNVGYLFLNKKSTLDIIAIKKLSMYIRSNQIDIIHAHASSFLIATIIKFLNSKINIVWHDHYGNSENLDKRKYLVLQFCSRYFAHILSVNRVLESWGKKHLKTRNINYLANFAIQDTSDPKTILFGEKGKRVLHLANLRPQKDHRTLLEAFSNILKEQPNWTLHCVGKDFNDLYSESIKKLIKGLNLSDHVFLYGSRLDITNIINQCNIGVLSSKSEGLPLALLEYGLSKIPVIATNVGDCNQVISNEKEGWLVNSKDATALADALMEYINDTDLRTKVAQNLYSKVSTSFSESSTIESLIKIYNKYK